MPNQSPATIAVVGGGVTGLTVAYRLLADSAKAGRPVRVVVLEAADRAGGLIGTAAVGDLVMELGPDCFISNKPAGVALVEELGLTARVIGTNPNERRSFVVRGGALAPLPAGFYLFAPNSLEALNAAGIFTEAGKRRIAQELDIPPRTDDADESLAGFVRRRFGDEMLERLAQPMAAGITTADPATMSMAALMPQFVRMERDYGSVIRALADRKEKEAAEAAASGPRYGLFLSLAGGMQDLIDALAARLPAGTVRVGACVTGLSRERAGWKVEVADGDEISADAVCVALPAHHAATLLAGAAPELAGELGRINYAPCALVNVAVRREQVAHPLNGMGFVVPAAEKRFLIGCSFSSVKFAGRAPAGTALLRGFVGGALQPENVGLPDEEMTRRVLADLRDLVGLTGAPERVVIGRWPRSMPQYHVGHLDRVATIERLAEPLPGFALAGNAYRGVGIPDSIASATAAAKRLMNRTRDVR